MEFSTKTLNPISHGVFDSDIFMGGILKTHSLKPDLTLSDLNDNHTMSQGHWNGQLPKR